MYEVSVESTFAAAHFLKDYHGKCENLHGHNYRVVALARGETLDKGGMLLDFSILKSSLKNVCGALDHTNLNCIDVFQNNPSAERIAKYVFDNLQSILIALGVKSSALYAVDVYETPTSKARYIAPRNIAAPSGEASSGGTASDNEKG